MKSLDVREAHDTSPQQNVSMFCMLAQKAAIRPDKVEHFTHTFESLPPEIYTGMQIVNVDNIYVYCTAHFHCARFCSGLQEHWIAGVRLRGG